MPITNTHARKLPRVQSLAPAMAEAQMRLLKLRAEVDDLIACWRRDPGQWPIRRPVLRRFANDIDDALDGISSGRPNYTMAMTTIERVEAGTTGGRFERRLLPSCYRTARLVSHRVRA